MKTSVIRRLTQYIWFRPGAILIIKKRSAPVLHPNPALLSSSNFKLGAMIKAYLNDNLLAGNPKCWASDIQKRYAKFELGLQSAKH